MLTTRLQNQKQQKPNKDAKAEPKTPTSSILANKKVQLISDDKGSENEKEDLGWYVDSDPNDPYASDKDEQHEIQIRSIVSRYESYYGPDNEERTCIWSGGDTFSWKQKASGLSWIGVNGTDAAFVILQRGKTLHRYVGYTGVLITSLCDIGVWADTSTASTQFRRWMIAQSSPDKVGPFAVVSVAPKTFNEDRQGSSHGASTAINFLTEKLKGRSAIPYKEIKQIAVCALKYLLGPKFDSNRIKVMGSGQRGENCLDNDNLGAFNVEQNLVAGGAAVAPAVEFKHEENVDENEESEDELGY